MKSYFVIVGVMALACIAGCGDDSATPFVFDAGVAKDAPSSEGGKDSAVEATADANQDATPSEGGKDASVADASTDGEAYANPTNDGGGEPDADEGGPDAIPE